MLSFVHLWCKVELAFKDKALLVFFPSPIEGLSPQFEDPFVVVVEGLHEVLRPFAFSCSWLFAFFVVLWFRLQEILEGVTACNGEVLLRRLWWTEEVGFRVWPDLFWHDVLWDVSKGLFCCSSRPVEEFRRSQVPGVHPDPHVSAYLFVFIPEVPAKPE